jgi:phosphoglycerate dehydrogenase-like enzyme
VDDAVMSAAPKLRWIATPTTGLNHVDLAAAERRGIEVISLRGRVDFLKNVRATAEMTVLLMLALLRHLPEAATHVREGKWNRDLFRGGELYGRTVGIVGYGRLGRIVARYLSGFECRVLATDLGPIETETGVTAVSLARLLDEADIVSLHADYRPANHGFWDRACFSKMKPGALFINTARGELVDERALLEALESGTLGGAALDVLAQEPPAGMEHPLIAFARRSTRLLITPHIGGGTVESLKKAETFLADALVQAVAGAREELCAESPR